MTTNNELNTLDEQGGLAVDPIAHALATSARAEVEAAYVMAIRNPRNEETARVKILAACRNPIFAAKAKYRKPVGSKQVNGRWEQQFIVGPSIRFAEEMLRVWHNILIQQSAVYDDATRRIVRVTVRDLESNIPYSKDITLDKTVERRNNKDRDTIGQRVNSQNEIVYIVRATEDELANKEAANVSKVIRNNGLRLIPQHIIDEALGEIDRVIREKVTSDPEHERRTLLDGFARRGIYPTEIEKYLGCPSAQFSPEQLMTLREILTSLEEGTITWAEYVEGTTIEDGKAMQERSQPDTKGKMILDKIGRPEPKAVEIPASPASVAEAVPVQSVRPSEQAMATVPAPVESAPAPATASDALTLVSSELKANIVTIENELQSTEGGRKWIQKIWRDIKVTPKGKSAIEALEPANLSFYYKVLQSAKSRMEKGVSPSKS